MAALELIITINLQIDLITSSMCYEWRQVQVAHVPPRHDLWYIKKIYLNNKSIDTTKLPHGYVW